MTSGSTPTGYTSVGVIRDELRMQIIGRAQRVGDSRTISDLEGTHYGPLVSMKTDHSTWCGCERGGDVEWPTSATRHNPHQNEIPPFGWAGGAR